MKWTSKMIIFLLLILKIANSQDEEYFEEDLSPSRFKIFGPFRDPPIRITSTTTEKPFDNETSTKNPFDNETSEKPRDEFVLGETSSSDNSLNQNNCQFVCQQPQCVQSQPCNCGIPSPPCFCAPRPPPLCPPPPLPLICPPPACPKPAACPPCIAIPTLPPPCICPPTYSTPAPQNDCCCNCNRPCRTTQRSKFQSVMFAAKTRKQEIGNSRCNSQQIRRIIEENISHDLEKAKHRIQLAATELVGKTLNVVCGNGEFSYIVQTQVYCQHSMGPTTCYVFESI